MSKVYTRLRMIDLDFGMILGTYFTESARKYDKTSDKSMDYINLNSKGHKAKFTKQKMQLQTFEHFLLKMVIYCGSFIFKILQCLYLNRAK
jgi:hypothetical protein